MIKRKYWLKKIEELWRGRSIVWLSGVRRVGKTVLTKSLPRVKYFDCELPRVRNMMADPERFLKNVKSQCLALDEIHRVDNPSEILKIAADHFPRLKILATGSSTLSASTKFRDTLAGRKAELWLTPIMSDDLERFRSGNLKHRLLFGGLPPFYLSRRFPEKYFQEWVDAYWAKDIQELFRLERRSSFQKFLELLMIQSGGIFEANKFANPCAVSHTTIATYLSVLEETYVAHVIRPFSTYKKTEIVAAPRVYMFDTGFVCYYKGIQELLAKETGFLWEHFVLNELQARLQSRHIHYWRDKQGHEVDFIIGRRGQPPIAIEAKWNSRDFNIVNLRVFLRQYPRSEALVVCADLSATIIKQVDGITITFMGISELARWIEENEIVKASS
ncbi:MAG: ATP-binding protein [Elusimicrobia bacterium]|nr:ATP-binding protein [Elusimicrobiota bacterium]